MTPRPPAMIPRPEQQRRHMRLETPTRALLGRVQRRRRQEVALSKSRNWPHIAQASFVQRPYSGTMIHGVCDG